MSLQIIANSMKAAARAHGSRRDELPHGAVLELKFADGVFSLTITRRLKQRRSNAAQQWQREVRTFAEHFGATADPEYTAQLTKLTFPLFEAVVTWREQDAQPVGSPLPQTPDEMQAWAKTLGPGVIIRHVNVFTGEMQ